MDTRDQCWNLLLPIYTRVPIFGIYSGYCSIFLFFWIVNPIQIYYKYMIDNPNPNSLLKTNRQSNPNIISHPTAILNPKCNLNFWIVNHNPTRKTGLQSGFTFQLLSKNVTQATYSGQCQLRWDEILNANQDR